MTDIEEREAIVRWLRERSANARKGVRQSHMANIFGEAAVLNADEAIFFATTAEAIQRGIHHKSSNPTQ